MQGRTNRNGVDAIVGKRLTYARLIAKVPACLPALLPFIAEDGPGVILATYDGFYFTVLWTDTISYILEGPQNLLGPTSTGSFVGLLLDGRQTPYSRLTILANQIGSGGVQL